MEFGERLRVLRMDKGLTQAEVASRVGVSRRSYVAYEQEGKHPRSRETYKKLADTLGCDVNDLLVEDGQTLYGASSLVDDLAGYVGPVGMGAAAGAMAAAGAFGLPAIGQGLSPYLITAALKTVTAKLSAQHSTPAESLKDEATPVSYAKETIQKAVKNHKQFAATSKGLIYSALAAHGISFTPGAATTEDDGDGPEEIISLQTNEFDSWWLTFEPGGEDLAGITSTLSIDARAKVLITQFYSFAPDPRRKASVVVGDGELFKAIMKMRGKNSYRGNLSAILIDRDEVSIASEGYIATYEEEQDVSSMFHVANEPAVD